MSTKKLQKITGKVISCKTPKTVQIKVNFFKVHPKYKKRYLVAKKFVAHNEQNDCKVGDVVEIIPCKPYSKTKRFMVVKKV